MSSVARPAPSAEPLDRVAVVLAVAGGLALLSGWGAAAHSVAVDRAGVVLGVAGVISAAALAVRPASGFRPSRLAMAWGAFLGWAAVCSAVSGRPWAALVGEETNLLGLLGFVAFTAVAVFSAGGKGSSVRRVLSVAALAVIALELALVVGQLATGMTPAGTLPNSTYLGEALVLLLPLLFLSGAEGGGTIQAAQWVLAVAGVAALAASGSRAAAGVAVLWLMWTVVRRTRLERPARLAAVVSLVVVIVGGGMLFARTELLGTFEGPSLGQRPEMWRVATMAALERPLTGFGPDGFIAGGVAVTTPRLAAESPVLLFAPGKTDPHNILVWALVSTGFVGLALFTWACIECTLRWIDRSRQGDDIAPLVWAIGGSFVIALTAPVTVHVVVLLGMVLGLSLGLPREQSPLPRVLPLVAVRSVLPFALMLPSVLYAANIATRLGLEEHGPRVSPGKAPVAQSSSDVWAVDAHLAHLASLHWGWAAQVDPAVNAAAPDLASIRRAVAVDRRDPFIALELARTLRFHGASDPEIEAAFRAAFDRWALYPTARAEYAIFLAQRGRLPEAREQLAIAELVDAGEEEELVAAVAQAQELLGD